MILALTLSITAVAGCSNLSIPNPFAGAGKGANANPPGETISATARPPPAGARTAAALDTTTDAEKAAALNTAPQPSIERNLGKVFVSLGNATEAGFWLRSSLVTQPTQGRITTTLGESLQVDLLPGDGAAQLSLAAYRALNLPLTGLPEVTVYAR
ncbi:MAG: D-galactarate dehydratase [Pseudorhodobacter sp.]